MSARITTRAGRKIRHVAPHKVEDVATGLTLRGKSGYWNATFPLAAGWTRSVAPRETYPRHLDSWLNHISRAAGICSLVRGMLAIGGWS